MLALRDDFELGDPVLRLINIEKYSNLEKLLRVTAYVFQFIIYLLEKVLGEYLSEGEFSSCIAKGEVFWVKEVQSTLCECVCVIFKNERKQLQFFEDPNSVWRCSGRIVNVNILYGKEYYTCTRRALCIKGPNILKANSTATDSGMLAQ